VNLIFFKHPTAHSAAQSTRRAPARLEVGGCVLGTPALPREPQPRAIRRFAHRGRAGLALEGAEGGAAARPSYPDRARRLPVSSRRGYGVQRGADIAGGGCGEDRGRGERRALLGGVVHARTERSRDPHRLLLR